MAVFSDAHAQPRPVAVSCRRLVWSLGSLEIWLSGRLVVRLPRLSLVFSPGRWVVVAVVAASTIGCVSLWW